MSTWKTWYKTERGDGFGVEIRVHSDRCATEDEASAAFKAACAIERAHDVAAAIADPETEPVAAQTVAWLSACFERAGLGPIYVERIPNEYRAIYPGWALRSPWLIVTTRIGHIRIGWRKRVIEIEWERSTSRIAGEDVTTDDVTKGDAASESPHRIHAWGYDKATEYLRAIAAAADITPPTKETP